MIFACPDCCEGKTTLAPDDKEFTWADWNAETLADKGTPVCTNCDNDMVAVEAPTEPDDKAL